jgi:[acyl-carrier-protein] S-malonyltransferase
MKAYIFLDKDTIYRNGKGIVRQFSNCKRIISSSNEILGYSITDIMFAGSADELKQTKSNATSRIFYIRLF